MKIVIVEDEEFAARRLENMLLQEANDIIVVAKLESVGDSVVWFQNNSHPDLIFLDIHLEDDLSFTIFEKVQIKSQIIFTSATDEFIVKSLKNKDIDYLLKPIIQEELNKVILKYRYSKDRMIDTSILTDLLKERDDRKCKK